MTGWTTGLPLVEVHSAGVLSHWRQITDTNLLA
jgi:hypothetical protein